MNPADITPCIAELQFQVARLQELNEQLLDGMDLVAQLPNSAEVETHLASLAGALLCICDECTVLLRRMHRMVEA